jgi:hypothetical protein
VHNGNDYMKNKKNPKKNLRAAVFALVVVGAIVGLLTVTGVIFKTTKKPPLTSGPTPEQKKESDQAAANAKQQLIESQKQGPSTTPDTTPPKTSVDLSAKQETNGNVTVFTTLHGYSSGTCDLKVTNGAKIISQSATVIYQPDFSTCAGFSVPISSLDKGTWNINLTVTAGGQSKSNSISFEVM